MTSKYAPSIKGFLKTVDWKLLLFLLLFCQVKLWIKLVAILFIYAVRPGFSFGFKWKKSRLPLFYPAMIFIGTANLFITGGFTNINYDALFLLGVFFWMLCLLAMHQIKLAVELHPFEIMYNTLVVFFLLNAIYSLFTYAGIVVETGTINPYRYQGNFQKYFIGTGDYIKGITFDTSTTNAVLNAFGGLFFLHYKKVALTWLCMAILLLTGSNMVNILLGICLLLLFIFKSSRDQKSMIIVCWLLLAIFLVKISPQNNSYIAATWKKITGGEKVSISANTKPLRITERPDSTLNVDEKREKIAQLYVDSVTTAASFKHKTAVQELLPDTVLSGTGKPFLPRDKIHTPAFQHKWDTTTLQKQLASFAASEKLVDSIPLLKQNKLPGKLQAYRQTLSYFKAHPAALITGTGIGNFASKLAFRATGLNIAGSYPADYRYINEAFKHNHLELQLAYYTANDSLHSLTNSPNGVYDQLLAEYGILGLLAFAFLYTGFFLRQRKYLSYGVPILLLMPGVFFTDYWFEQLSVVIVFELLLFMDIKQNKTVQHV